MGHPVLAAGSLELAESLVQAGPVPVAGTKQQQDQEQQEAEEQPSGQGAARSDPGGAVGGCPAVLTVAALVAVADPMPVATAPTFLCSQESLRLAPAVHAHHAGAAGCTGQSQERLGHVTAEVQVHPGAVQLGPIGFHHLPEPLSSRAQQGSGPAPLALELPTDGVARGAGHVAAIRAAPAAPKHIPPRVGCAEAKRLGRLGSGPPERLALLGVRGTAPVHAHSLAAGTGLAVSQAGIRGALRAVS